MIPALDGKTVQGLSLNDAVDKMRGAPNSKITLTIKRENVDKPIEISMQREVIHIQVVKSRHGAGRYRLYPPVAVHRADGRRPRARRSTTLKQQSGGKLRGVILDLRNNPGRPARPGGRGVRRLHRRRARSSRPAAATPRTASAGTPRAATSPSGLPLVVLINGGSASRQRDRRRARCRTTTARCCSARGASARARCRP